MITDITERKHAEERLHKSEENYRRIVETALEGIFVFDANWHLSYANARFAEILGYGHDEILGRPISDFILEKDQLSHEIRKARQAAGQTSVHENMYRTKSGKPVWLLISVSPIIEDGKHIGSFGMAIDITEQKRMIAALQESEERFRTAFMTVADAFVIVEEATGLILEANDHFLELYGYTRKEVIGHTSLELGMWANPESRASLLSKLQMHDRVENLEVFAQRKDGEKFWVLYSVSRLKHEGQQLILGAIRDITERKQTEEIVHNRNRMLLTLHNVALQVGSELRLPELLANALGQAQSFLNADRGGGVYLYEADEQVLRLAHGTGINRGRDGITVRIGDGVAGHVYQTAQPIVIDDYTHWDGHATILVNEPEHPSTVMGVPLFVGSKVMGVLTFIANSKFRKFSALDVQQAEMFAAQVAIAIQNAQLYLKAQDEIAERAKAQDELRSLNEKLEQRVAQRTAELNHTNIELEHANRAKDEFLANMSHELRSPLNSILGLSETLLEQRRGVLNENQQRFLQTIEASGRHLLDLINDILDLSKIEAGKFDCYPESVLLDDVCNASLAFVKNQAVKKSVTVLYKNETNISKISADPRRLKQILVNLLTNAVKFTPERGLVTLQVHAESETNSVQLSVTDTGIGIAPADLQKLFQPFVQVDNSLTRSHEGTGLGLALVQKLTDLHGGSIQVESTVGQGSCFTVNLPWTPDFVQAAIPAPATSQSLKITPTESVLAPVNHKRGLILLAEDNKANIVTIGEYLESYEYEVVIAHDGLETLEKVEAIKPDLILMDIQMPVMDGLEATRRLRANPRFATTPIIGLTALAMPGDRERCLAAGANEYMSKPVKLISLVKMIQDFLKL